MTEILLEQLISTMPPSQRVSIVDEEGRNLYKGYVANLIHSGIDRMRQVVKTNISTDVRKAAGKNERMPLQEKTVIPEENLGEYKFSDLECVVYQNVVIKAK